MKREHGIRDWFRDGISTTRLAEIFGIRKSTLRAWYASEFGRKLKRREGWTAPEAAILRSEVRKNRAMRTTGEVAAILRINPTTIIYWSARGFRVPPRTPILGRVNGRYWSRSDVRRLKTWLGRQLMGVPHRKKRAKFAQVLERQLYGVTDPMQMRALDVARAVLAERPQPEPSRDEIARVCVETFTEELKSRGEATPENVERLLSGFVDFDVSLYRPMIRAHLGQGVN